MNVILNFRFALADSPLPLRSACSIYDEAQSCNNSTMSHDVAAKFTFSKIQKEKYILQEKLNRVHHYKATSNQNYLEFKISLLKYCNSITVI